MCQGYFCVKVAKGSIKTKYGVQIFHLTRKDLVLPEKKLMFLYYLFTNRRDPEVKV